MFGYESLLTTWEGTAHFIKVKNTMVNTQQGKMDILRTEAGEVNFGQITNFVVWSAHGQKMPRVRQSVSCGLITRHMPSYSLTFSLWYILCLSIVNRPQKFQRTTFARLCTKTWKSEESLSEWSGATPVNSTVPRDAPIAPSATIASRWGKHWNSLWFVWLVRGSIRCILHWSSTYLQDLKSV